MHKTSKYIWMEMCEPQASENLTVSQVIAAEVRKKIVQIRSNKTCFVAEIYSLITV